MIKSPDSRFYLSSYISNGNLVDAKKLLDTVFSSSQWVFVAEDLISDITHSGDLAGWIDCLGYVLEHYPDHQVVAPRPLVHEYIRLIDFGDFNALDLWRKRGSYLRVRFKREEFVRMNSDFWENQEQYFATLPHEKLKQAVSENASTKTLLPPSL